MKRILLILIVTLTFAMDYSCQKDEHLGQENIYNRLMIIANNTQYDCNLTFDTMTWVIKSHSSIGFPYEDWFYDAHTQRPIFNHAHLEFVDQKGTSIDFQFDPELGYTPAIHNLLDPSLYFQYEEDRVIYVGYTISPHDYQAALNPSYYSK